MALAEAEASAEDITAALADITIIIARTDIGDIAPFSAAFITAPITVAAVALGD